MIDLTELPPSLRVAAIHAKNPEALFIGAEPEDVERFAHAIIGTTNTPDDHWPRPKDGPWVAVYDAEAVILLHAEDFGGDIEAGAEWFHFNTEGGWHGPSTATFHYASDEDEDAG